MNKRIFWILLASFCVVLLPSALSAQPYDPAMYQELRWRMIGPFRGGRTVSISGVPGQPNVFYMAPNNGGVWKTTDFGRTWNPIFDDQPTGSIGALAVAPSDPKTIYVGSGEGLRRPDLSVGDGIYKSTDAGRTWQHLGLRDALQIASIVIDPKDPNRLFVAAQGHPYGPNSERGVYRSLDGGQTFEKVFYKDENVGAMDLVFDPRNSAVIFASMWASRRPPWTTGGGYNGPGSGLYKSSDGGNTWRQLTKGLPGAAEGIGRIGPAVSPSAPDRMYAWVNARKGSGIYRSDDAGESWQQTNDEERVWGRGDDFGCVRVDPRNKDVIYVANTSTYRSVDAGRNFTAIKGAPGGDDYHTIWINPEIPDIIAIAVDQGATISVNGGETWSSWYNQPTAQFYHVITDNEFPYWVYGGQQESGSIGTASRSDFGEITFRDWTTVGVEEYGYVAPDPLHPNLIYGGKVTVFDRNTGQTRDVSPVVLRTGQYRFNRTAPLIFSAADPHVLYLGSNVLFSTRDGGNTWQVISPDLTREDPGVPETLGPFVADDPAKGKHRGVIYSVAPSPKDANLIWAGTDDGLIHVTHDGGKNWQNVTPPELTPWSKLAQMDASHFDTAIAYAAANRFRLDDLHPYIYRTHDGGKSWQKIVSGLPENEPVNTVREDPERKGLLFAGTERSVYVSWDDGDHWQALKMNLPPTSIRDLVVHHDDVVVGTHGRSFWILDNIAPLRQVLEARRAAGPWLYRPATVVRIDNDSYSGSPLPPEEPTAENPPNGAMIDYFLPSPASAVRLEVFDEQQNLVRSFSSEDPRPAKHPPLPVAERWFSKPEALEKTAGMHRFVWNLAWSSSGGPSADEEAEYRNPSGPRIVPGIYQVRLTVDEKTQHQSLKVIMDPRSPATPEVLTQQLQLGRQIFGETVEARRALAEIGSVQKQLADIQQKLGAQSEQLKSALADAQSAIGKILTNKEHAAAEGPGLQDAYTGLASALRVGEGGDRAVPSQAIEVYRESSEQVKARIVEWARFKQTGLAQLNQRLREANFAPIAIAEIEEQVQFLMSR